MLLQEIESMIRHASGELWGELPIWAQTPPIGHRALSALVLALGDSDPRFIHVRAKPDSAAFSLWVFTDTELILVANETAESVPSVDFVDRRSLVKVSITSTPITTVTQHGAAAEPLTFRVAYPDLDLELSTRDVDDRSRRRDIDGFLRSILNDLPSRRDGAGR
ncbi:hypothetical protein ACPPVQ_04585 [Diaminobutyricibacter sp. McL0618]|uniref:hypothetical protein n=1 Tax=Leifsonia sp. McL0618 TaxID=3415677 RepID=UPI003CE789E1